MSSDPRLCEGYKGVKRCSQPIIPIDGSVIHEDCKFVPQPRDARSADEAPAHSVSPNSPPAVRTSRPDGLPTGAL